VIIEAELAQLLNAGMKEIDKRRGREVGRRWAEENIVSEEHAQAVLYALGRAYPAEEEGLFVSYGWSSVRRALPDVPVVVEFDLEREEEGITRGGDEFDQLLHHIASLPLTTKRGRRSRRRIHAVGGWG
jgi:hypothetical protein